VPGRFNFLESCRGPRRTGHCQRLQPATKKNHCRGHVCRLRCRIGACPGATPAPPTVATLEPAPVSLPKRTPYGAKASASHAQLQPRSAWAFQRDLCRGVSWAMHATTPVAAVNQQVATAAEWNLQNRERRQVSVRVQPWCPSHVQVDQELMTPPRCERCRGDIGAPGKCVDGTPTASPTSSQ